MSIYTSPDNFHGYQRAYEIWEDHRWGISHWSDDESDPHIGFGNQHTGSSDENNDGDASLGQLQMLPGGFCWTPVLAIMDGSGSAMGNDLTFTEGTVLYSCSYTFTDPLTGETITVTWVEDGNGNVVSVGPITIQETDSSTQNNGSDFGKDDTSGDDGDVGSTDPFNVSDNGNDTQNGSGEDEVDDTVIVDGNQQLEDDDCTYNWDKYNGWVPDPTDEGCEDNWDTVIVVGEPLTDPICWYNANQITPWDSRDHMQCIDEIEDLYGHSGYRPGEGPCIIEYTPLWPGKGWVLYQGDCTEYTEYINDLQHGVDLLKPVNPPPPSYDKKPNPGKF